MVRTPIAVLFLLSVVAVHGSSAQTVARQDTAGTTQRARSGTWSAATADGLRLAGTWTAVPDQKSATVTGTWTLTDARGETVAGGGWSAAKSPTRWTGGWRAVIAGRDGDYAGTWTAAADLEPNGGFDDLFEQAVKAVMRGTWRAGQRSGPWAIRALARERAP